MEDVTVGACAVAAPIMNAAKEVIGTISIAGASNNFKGDKLESYVKLLKETAKQISLRMGWVG
ncbi:MAG: IclR family KDG regulon transcriptional repressor [Clostridium sp.]|jgi:IclR family KDG regulon transcriptional repressor